MSKKYRVLIIVPLVISVWIITTVLFAVKISPDLEEMYDIVSAMEEYMPPRSEGVDVPTDDLMPVFNYKDNDYIALLEITDSHDKFPVLGKWDDDFSLNIPCRYSGTVYADNLIIGADTDSFEFISTLDNGDTITVTDMKGNEYTLYLENVKHYNTLDIERIVNENKSVVLFSYSKNLSCYLVAYFVK